ncbi:MAG: hypothetical protein ACRDLA_14250 [Thermoleophilaceae bacterium]
MAVMNISPSLEEHADELLREARAFQEVAERPGSHAAAPQSLEFLIEALQVLSDAWYHLAADASPGIVERRRLQDGPASWPHVSGLSREQEIRLMGTLHDVAAAFDRCARACREGRSTVAPIIATRLAAERADSARGGSDLSWFGSRTAPTRRVA